MYMDIIHNYTIFHLEGNTFSMYGNITLIDYINWLFGLGLGNKATKTLSLSILITCISLWHKP